MFIASEIFVFRTNVRTRRLAIQLCKSLEKQGLAQKATLDLDDCDRVLRVESIRAGTVDIQKLAIGMGVSIEELA